MDGVFEQPVKLMYKVRRAVPEDFHALLPMAESFYKSTSFFKTMDYDVPSMLEHYISLLTHGVVLLGEADGKLVGMLGLSVQPFSFNQNHLVCSESMWWVEPEHRKSPLAGMLEEAMAKYAEERGCSHMIMAMLDTSPQILAERYEAQGYHKTETAFMKEI